VSVVWREVFVFVSRECYKGLLGTQSQRQGRTSHLCEEHKDENGQRQSHTFSGSEIKFQPFEGGQVDWPVQLVGAGMSNENTRSCQVLVR
jgi:hypothetical protein